ncbi:MAG TPA: hypothetical protein VF596_12475 [Pyrinomonadaceae bacterium]|jgi:hypothetical protein
MEKDKSRRNFLKQIGVGAVTLTALTKADPKFLTFGQSIREQPASRPTPITKKSPRSPVEFFAENIKTDNNPLPASLRSPFYNSRLIKDTWVINAVEVEIKQENISSLHNLVVYADKIKISGTVKLPGRNVLIYSRLIEGSGEIDVSGNDGRNIYENNPASPGVNAGDAGGDGNPGENGSDAGNILVIANNFTGQLNLKSNGGKGGRGQDGGKGAVGRNGANGADAEKFFQFGTNNRDGQTGGPGIHGGNGGKRGKGGNGSNAGSIEANLISLTNAGNLKMFSIGGQGGDPGSVGQGGEGGNGGMGGQNIQCNTHCCGRQCDNDCTSCHFTTRAPNGPKGPTGNPGSVTGNDMGETKTSKNPILNQINTEFLGKTASYPQVSMLFHKAEIAYLNGQFDLCAGYFGWIEEITRNAPGSAVPQPGIWGSPSNAPVKVSNSEWSALRNRTLLFLNRMSVGLDYYGQPKNYVPLVDLESYKNDVEKLLDISDKLKTAYDNYYTAGENRDAQRTALTAAINKAQEVIADLQNEVNDTDRFAEEASRKFQGLTQSLLSQEQDIFLADTTFQNAVKKQSGGCNLIDTITFVASVVAVAYGAYGATASLINSVKNLASATSSLPDIVKNLKEVGKNLNEARDAYQSVKDKLANHSNDTKLVATLDDFEKILKPFMDMPEAQKYKKILELYVDTARTRNQTIIDFTSLKLKREAIAAEIALRQAEIIRVESTKALDYDPGLVEMSIFMEKLYSETLINLTRLIYQEYKALDYWALTITDFKVTNQTLEDLRGIHGNLIIEEKKAAENRNRDTQQWSVKIIISDTDFPAEFKKLRKTGKMNFTIPVTHPDFNKGWFAITAKEVMVRLPKAKTDDNVLSITLTHSGQARFIDPDRHIIEFSHRPRATQITYNVLTGKPCDLAATPSTACTSIANNLGSKDGKYAQISPFTVWALNVSPEFNKNPKLAVVKTIELEFKGNFLPPNS